MYMIHILVGSFQIYGILTDDTNPVKKDYVEDSGSNLFNHNLAPIL